MYSLRPLPALLGLSLLTSCTLRMQPAERAKPGVMGSSPYPPPTPGPAGSIKRPVPPPVYRLGHLDTLVLGHRVLRLYPAAREVYEKLPVQPWLVSGSAAEGDEFDPEAEERRRLRKAGADVKRLGRVLALRGRSGKEVRLVSNPTEDYETSVVYEYVATLPGIKQWLVAVRLYEGGYYLLVDQQTGRQTVVWSPPSVAPDGLHFVCGSSDVLARYEPSGLQVWSMTSGRPRLLWERQTEWGVSQPKWLDNHSILFEQDFIHNGDVDTRVMRLKLVN
ncbi:hypothetical protein [Hymenobacter latericus]|uniref:hypothetical protein n=1 Tax=Hymenobacter sp. YIM 151858-1 TaxID=2987688 RepID=UPI0022278341|nr:hypothetical protein [Hymenobacter sp. YIM 151858-1]UYZ57759.1 hypothetical protein OIS50_11860 [Hymenobacter sp. YIM 151858-1]